MGRALRTPVTGPARGIRKVTHAQGAGESGLGRLIELHGVNGAGDVMITVALASTVFFSVPTDEARGRVALYLAVTMLPFTLLGLGNGYRLTAQATGVVNMVTVLGLSVVGGLWFPAEALPAWLSPVAAYTPASPFAALGRAVLG
ncbi:hypothetical protein ADL27_30945, partial [Streptomyces sp. NRRL F-6602]